VTILKTSKAFCAAKRVSTHDAGVPRGAFDLGMPRREPKAGEKTGFEAIVISQEAGGKKKGNGREELVETPTTNPKVYTQL